MSVWVDWTAWKEECVMFCFWNHRATLHGVVALGATLAIASAAAADHRRSSCGVSVSIGSSPSIVTRLSVPSVTRVYTASSYHPFVYSSSRTYSTGRTCSTVPTRTLGTGYTTPTYYPATSVPTYGGGGYGTAYVAQPGLVVPQVQCSTGTVLRSTSGRIYGGSSRIYPTSTRIYPTTSTYYYRAPVVKPRISVGYSSSRVARIPSYTRGVSISRCR